MDWMPATSSIGLSIVFTPQRAPGILRSKARPAAVRRLIHMSAAAAAAASPAAAPFAAADGVELKHYVDVHCHIIHEKFEGEEDAVAERARAKGLEFCVVNGLEPRSNRAVLELCERHPTSLLPALGASSYDLSNWSIFSNHPV